MDIHEYQAKEILRRSGVIVPGGALAYSPQQAVNIYRNLPADSCMVKAQIHSGARGKAGGVKLCRKEEEVSVFCQNIFGSTLVTKQTGPQGKKVEKVYVEETTEIKREIFFALLIDRASERVIAIASAQGGMEIEQLAKEAQESILRVSIDPAVRMQPFQARELAFGLGLTGGPLLKYAANTFLGCYDILLELDAELVEINPLVITNDDRLVALDAKVSFDDNALFRHPNVVEMRDKSQEDQRETRASDHDLSYVGLDGNIGCMINGAGLAMATMDMIKFAGGEPANFLDIGGGASPERVAKAFELVLEDKGVKAMLVNIYAGINRCDWIAEGIIKALKIIKIDVPLVVRLSGTNVDIGRQMIADSEHSIISVKTIGEAAERAVQAANLS